MIHKKTAFRPSLDPKGTLSIILTVKLANDMPAYQFEPTKDLLKTAKSAINSSHTCFYMYAFSTYKYMHYYFKEFREGYPFGAFSRGRLFGRSLTHDDHQTLTAMQVTLKHLF